MSGSRAACYSVHMRANRGSAQRWRVRCTGLWAWAVVACLLLDAPLTAAQASPAGKPAPTRPAQVSLDEYGRAVEAAVAAYNRDDYATARRYFARAHELRPSARTWRGLGTTAFELKSYEDAVRELTFALEDTRSALPDHLRAETELTLRVARRRLAEGDAPAAPQPRVASASEAQAPAAPAGAVVASEDANAGGLDGQRVAAIFAAGVGAVALGVGVGFGLHSLAQGRERDRLCPTADQALGCSLEAKRAADAAITAGNLSTVGWVVGGLGLGSAVVLWLTASERAQRGASVSIGPGNLQVSGRF